jgi:hypothetical protein
MTMDRRNFLILTGSVTGCMLLPHAIRARAQERFIQEPGPWRRFEVLTRLDMAKPQGRVQAWVPVPSVEAPDWTKPMGSDWKTNAKAAKLKVDTSTGAAMVHLQWAEGETAPYAEISCDITTRDRSTDFSRPQKAMPLLDEERKRYTPLPPDTNLVRSAHRITDNAMTDLGKAKAIYEWIVETMACGFNRKAVVFRRNAADLNVLFVRLANAAGLPARIIYGLRIAPSLFGYGSLGTPSDTVTRAQHTRAEVWLEEYGWMPADPADVCKVVKEESPVGVPSADAKIASARLTLFGAWEGNWIAYNMANNVQLPGYDLDVREGSKDSAVKSAFSVSTFMHPQAETGGRPVDCLDPDNFKYVIKAKELPA